VRQGVTGTATVADRSAVRFVVVSICPQIFDNDYLDGTMQFKVRGIGKESFEEGNKRYSRDFSTWELMFSNSTPACSR
jgi:hypothetical protein